ncbi:hypothetical protein D3C77_781800 [compost metagenome]
MMVKLNCRMLRLFITDPFLPVRLVRRSHAESTLAIRSGAFDFNRGYGTSRCSPGQTKVSYVNRRNLRLGWLL